MADPFVGEIGIFGFPFVPLGWAACNGATMLIQQNSALYSLIGVSFGGDGTTRFQLPNLVDRAMCGTGTGPGLTRRDLGDVFGEAAVVIDGTTLPPHNHGLAIRDGAGTRQSIPDTSSALSAAASMSLYVADSQPQVGFAPTAVTTSGNGQPHENRQPFLGLNMCISLQGVFPAFP
jgi:microcystin-dependent protein